VDSNASCERRRSRRPLEDFLFGSGPILITPDYYELSELHKPRIIHSPTSSVKEKWALILPT
jgi:hypothetical protein